MTVNDIAEGVPLRRLTRLLAEMQTTINAAGLRLFDGDLDRFVIFTLVLREGLPGRSPTRPISAHSLSTSLDRSFETVRRHVNALIAEGLCARVKGGVIAAPDVVARSDMQDMLALTHDSFVRFVGDLALLGWVPVAGRSAPYDAAVGVRAAVDIMLTVVDSNRGLHGDWLDLVLFSTILCANAQRYDDDVARLDGEPLGSRHAVRPSVIARVLSIAETTVRRRVARLAAEGGPIELVPGGLLVSQRWLATPEAAATTAATLAGVRREVRRAVVLGFPIDAPASAYMTGRPPAPVFV